MRLFRPSRRPLESPRRIAARMPWRCRRIVRASLTNGSSCDLDAHASQASRCAGASAGVLELVEQPQLLLEQERPVERLLACWTSARSRAAGLLGGRLQERPAGALDPRPLACASARARSTHRAGPGRRRAGRDGPRGTGRSRPRPAGSPRGSPSHSRPTCRSRRRGSSSCARRAGRRTPAASAALRPGEHHTIAPERWSTTEVR